MLFSLHWSSNIYFRDFHVKSQLLNSIIRSIQFLFLTSNTFKYILKLLNGWKNLQLNFKQTFPITSNFSEKIKTPRSFVGQLFSNLSWLMHISNKSVIISFLLLLLTDVKWISMKCNLQPLQMWTAQHISSFYIG